MVHCYGLALSMGTIHWKSYLMSNDSSTIIGSFVGSEMVLEKKRVRATLESSSKKESFDRISSCQESWNYKNWIWEILYLTDKNNAIR